MSSINDGGAAFPHPQGWRRDPEISDGMSLRDWFAGQALAGLLANPSPVVRWPNGCGNMAEEAYNMADAMLRARQRSTAVVEVNYITYVLASVKLGLWSLHQFVQAGFPKEEFGKFLRDPAAFVEALADPNPLIKGSKALLQEEGVA